MDPHAVTSPEQLVALYDAPKELVLRKQIDHLDKHCRTFIAASPLVLLATSGPGGVDCSPRGDEAGFVQVQDDHTLLLPDRPGNNRLDSLRNIVGDPRVGLLFLVPGVGETMRVNGDAAVTTHPDLLARFELGGRPPRSVLRVTVREAFIHCSRALVRSALWDPTRHRDRGEWPSITQILADHTASRGDAGR